MLDYQKFYYAIHNLKKFMNEQDKLEAVLKTLAPSSNVLIVFGNEFIDAYITILEQAVNDDSNWVSWFVFENEFGANKLKVKLPNGKWRKIDSEKTLYDLLIKKP